MDIADYLSQRGVPFERLTAPVSDGLGGAAEPARRQLAQTELLRTSDGFVVVVLPATHQIDRDSLQLLLGVRLTGPASQEELADVFPGLTPNEIPPFGGEYGIRTVVDVHLARFPSVIFRNGRRGAVRMDYEDFVWLESPITGRFATTPTVRSESQGCRENTQAADRSRGPDLAPR